MIILFALRNWAVSYYLLRLMTLLNNSQSKYFIFLISCDFDVVLDYNKDYKLNNIFKRGEWVPGLKFLTLLFNPPKTERESN